MDYRRIAEELADQGDLDEAWSAFKAADRELLQAYAPDELVTETARLRLEAKNKLVEWRQEFILQRLPETYGTPTDVMAESTLLPLDVVQRCRQVLDDGLDNRYRKLDMLRYRLRWSALSLIVTLVIASTAWLVAVGTGLSPAETTHLMSDWRSFLVMLSLGALGASLSGLLSLRDQKLTARIPDLSEVWALVVWRPVVGAASAFVLVLVLQSGVGGLALDSSAALVAAVVAGFTEQAVTSAIGTASASIARK